MSKQVDERIVSMRFDNKQFESNVQTSIGTLDKLKQKLNLNGASKGLENINSAAKNVNMSGLATGIETVRTKFSALEVMGVTALANITNSAVNAGKQIVSALTIQPVTTGFNEYELKLDSVRTIMASTGESIETVNKYLEELNTYSDQTIYSFSDMTQNIGKFTNAGVKLEDAVLAIKGISNEAALSGANTNEAARAMYNFAQALSVGYIQRIDWKSIELANMATVEFKEQLLDAAVAAGTVTKTAEGMYATLENPDKAYNAAAMFTETLDDQWLTTEVLIATLKDYADETTDIGKRAYAAAQEVTKLSQIFDIAKEVAQSGWAQTWELIFGNLEQAKGFFSPISEALTNLQLTFIKFRNGVLESALGKGFGELAEKLSGILDPVKETVDTVKDATEVVKDYSKVVDEIIAGKWGNAPTRWQDLTKAGYDWAHAQNLVNERLGVSLRRTTSYTEAQNNLNNSQTKSTETQTKLTATEAKRLEQLVALSDAELKALGYSKEQIEALRELKKTADKLGLSISELIENIDKIDGRWLLMESLKNFGNAILGTFKAIGDAFKEIFNIDQGNVANNLFNIIAALHKFSRSIRLTNEETGELNDTGLKIKRTFKGIFAVLDIITTLVGGAFKIAFKIVSKILDAFGYSVLDITAIIGDALVGFRDWINSALDLTNVFKNIVPFLKKAGSGISEWVEKLKTSEDLPKDIADGLINGFTFAVRTVGNILAALGNNVLTSLKTIPFFSGIIEGIEEWIAKLKESENIPGDIISGLVNGLRTGIPLVGGVMIEIGKAILAKIRDILGIHSPSTEFFEIGRNIIQGLINGIKEFSSLVWELLRTIMEKSIDIIKEVDLGAVLATAFGLGVTTAITKIAVAIDNLTDPLDGFGDVLNQTSKGIKRFSKALSTNLKAQAIKSIAISIGILVASIVVLTFLDPGKVWASIGAIAALAAIIGILSVVIGKFGPSQATDFGKMALAIMAISASMLIMAMALKKIANIEPDRMKQAIDGLITCLLSMSLLMLIFGSMPIKASSNIDKAGKTFLKMAGAFLIMAIVVKIVSKLDDAALTKGLIVITAFSGIIVGLMAASQLAGNNIDNIGSTIFKIAGAMTLMTLTMKIVAGMKPKELATGLGVVLAFSGIISGLIFVSKLAGNDIKNIGSTILGIGAAMAVMAIAMKIVGGMDTKQVITGIAVVTAFGGIITGLIAATKLAGKNIKNIGKTILLISAAIAVLAVTTMLLSFIDPLNLLKGVAAMGALSAMMAGMIIATKSAKKCTGNLIVLTVAVAVMAGAIALLSMIDPARIAIATIALTSVMGMFALLMLVSTTLKTGEKAWKRSVAIISTLAVVVAIIGAVIYIVARSNPLSAIASAAAISLLLSTLVGCMVVSSKLKTSNMTGTLVALGVLALVMGALGLILAMMSALKVDNAITNAVALTILISALAGVAAILSLIGNASSDILMGALGLAALTVVMALLGLVLAMMSALKVQDALVNATALAGLIIVLTMVAAALAVIGWAFVGILLGAVGLAALTVVMALLGLVLAMMSALKIENAMQNATVLIMLLTHMAAICTVLAMVGPMALIGVAAMTALVGLMLTIGVLVVAIGALMQQFPALQSFLNTGIPVMVQLAGGIGEMIGAFVAGLAEQLASSLPSIGLALSQFMTNAMVFITGAKMVDESVLTGVGILAATVIALTAADLLAGITSFLTGGSSFADLGIQLSEFITNAMPFIVGSRLIDPEVMTGVKTLAEAILILTGANMLENITSWLGGESSLATFGSQLGQLGTDLGTFVTNLGTFTEEQVATVTCAANAIKALSEAAKATPSTGGLWQGIVGESGLAGFSSELPNLGTNLNSFITNLGTFDNSHLETVKVAGESIKALAEAAKEIPATGGLWQGIVGESGLSKFSGELPSLGTNLKTFITNLGTFDDSRLETVKVAGEAIKALATAANAIPKTGGLWQKIVGEDGLSKFSGELPKLGTNLNTFITNLGTFGTDKLNTVKSASQVITSISTIAKDGMDFSNIKTLGEKIKTLADDLSTFASKLSGVSSSSLDAANGKVKGLISLAKTAAGTNVSSLKTFGSSLKSLAKEGVEGFVAEFKTKSPKDEIKKAAEAMMKSFTSAIEGKKDDAKKKAKSVANSAVDGIENVDLEAKGKSSGKDLGTGLVNGIKAKETDAYNAGFKLGQKAVQGEKDGQESKSPSKATTRAGKWLGEGLVIGIDKMGTAVYNSGKDMGKTAVNSISKAISNISEIIDSDIDSQPTIRPVLDLSDVRSGASTIGGMFGSRTLSVNTHSVGSIAASMSGIQNRGNDDIVSAIKALRKDISDMPRDSVIIDGITYDDGSNISDAVRSLVRAAKVERRI